MSLFGGQNKEMKGMTVAMIIIMTHVHIESSYFKLIIAYDSYYASMC